MKHLPGQSRKPNDANATDSNTDRNSSTLSPPGKSSDSKIPYESPYAGLKLTPWDEIWATVNIAKMRGNTYMVRTFYEILFREAVFDDHGAWSLVVRNFIDKKNPSSG